MSLESNKSVVRSFFERAINRGDLAWLDQIIAPGFGASATGTHPSGQAGPERARALIERYRRAFPDIQFTVEDLLAEGDRVVVRITFRGTQRGEFMGVPATGRPVAGSGVELAILANGQIAAAGWEYHDDLGLLRQMGALPAHGQPADGHSRVGGRGPGHP